MLESQDSLLEYWKLSVEFKKVSLPGIPGLTRLCYCCLAAGQSSDREVFYSQGRTSAFLSLLCSARMVLFHRWARGEEGIQANAVTHCCINTETRNMFTCFCYWLWPCLLLVEVTFFVVFVQNRKAVILFAMLYPKRSHWLVVWSIKWSEVKWSGCSGSDGQCI